MERGQVNWCDLDPRGRHDQGDVRPVVVISADKYSVHGPVDQARFIDRTRLRAGPPAGKLIADAQRRLERSLVRILGLEL